MSGTCKEWFDSIGCKSTLDKEQYTHLVWCAALASKVENFTDNQQREGETVKSCTNCMLPNCSLKAGYCHKWVLRTASPVA